MEVIDAIHQRRSVRRYLDRDVETEAVRKIIDAAIQAPSGLNQQPWAFAVFHGHQRLKDYSNRAKRYLISHYPTTFEPHPRTQLYEDPDYDMFYGAGTLIVIYAIPGKLDAAEDCCLAAENLMLAAHALGLGTCPIGFARPWLDLPETKRMLDVPEHYHAIFPLVVGYPDGEPEPVPRRSPEIATWQWDTANVASPAR